MVVAVSPVVVAENLVKNGSFSEELTSWSKYTFTGNPEVEVVDGTLIFKTSATDRVTVGQTLEGFIPGSTYVLRAKVKTDGPLQGERRTNPGGHCGCGYIRLQFRDEDWQHVRNNLHSRVILNEADWNEVISTFEIPEGTTRLQVEISSAP